MHADGAQIGHTGTEHAQDCTDRHNELMESIQQPAEAPAHAELPSRLPTNIPPGDSTAPGLRPTTACLPSVMFHDKPSALLEATAGMPCSENHHSMSEIGSDLRIGLQFVRCLVF